MYCTLFEREVIPGDNPGGIAQRPHNSHYGIRLPTHDKSVMKQWLAVNRKHALLLISDYLYYNKIKYYCKVRIHLPYCTCIKTKYGIHKTFLLSSNPSQISCKKTSLCFFEDSSFLQLYYIITSTDFGCEVIVLLFTADQSLF